MPEEKRPLKVFPSASLRASLCHAHSDAEAVRALDGRVGGVFLPYRDHNRLISDGVVARLDKEKLLPGQDWDLETHKVLQETIDV
jgi:hypothetical protein